MASDPTFVANYRTQITQFVNSGAVTQAIWRAGPTGSRIHLMTATQDDTTTAVMSLYQGKILTDNAKPFPFAPPDLQGLCPVLAITNTTNSTITRTNGSFIQDGWSLSKMLAVLCAFDNPQNQIAPAHPTTIAAATLTFTGAIFNAAAAASAISAGVQLAQVMPLWAVSMVSGAGTGSVAAINLMSTSLFPAFMTTPDTFLALGPNEILVCSCATLPAAAKSINVLVVGGDW